MFLSYCDMNQALNLTYFESNNTVCSASSGGKARSEVNANGRRPGGISTMLQLQMIKNSPACDPFCVME